MLELLRYIGGDQKELFKQSSTTTFHAVYGQPPPFIPRYFVGSSLVEEVDISLIAPNRILYLATSINHMKQLSDVCKRNDEFAVGNILYLMLHKRAARYYGPYPIVERVGVVAYWL